MIQDDAQGMTRGRGRDYNCFLYYGFMSFLSTRGATLNWAKTLGDGRIYTGVLWVDRYQMWIFPQQVCWFVGKQRFFVRMRGHLSIGSWVLYSGILLYLHNRNSKLFSIQQSLINSKMRTFWTIKLSQLHRAKTCWTENCWSSGIMSNFWGQFFMFWGGTKNSKIFQQLFKIHN